MESVAPPAPAEQSTEPAQPALEPATDDATSEEAPTVDLGSTDEPVTPPADGDSRE
jgi:hypothetical protein